MDKSYQLAKYGIGLVIYGGVCLLLGKLLGLSSIEPLQANLLPLCMGLIVIGVGLIVAGIRSA